MNVSPLQGLGALVDRMARFAGQRIPAARLSDVGRLLESESHLVADPLGLFTEAWRQLGLDGAPVRLHNPKRANLPFAAFVADTGWVLLQTCGHDGTWEGTTPDGTLTRLVSIDGALCVSVPHRSTAKAAQPNALRLVFAAMWERKSIFFDAVVATGLVSMLSLAASLYSMQVFDRVIPNQGFQTLLVLTVGVAFAVTVELLLKQTRSHIIDRACTAIDCQLSDWFFGRMLGIRMEARPPTVGTLASQVKGFEMVRGVLASTSIFVLADVPFALLFLLVIATVGGWVAVVPLVALPIALTLGLMFQKAIQRQTRLNLSASNRKAGLLVEAVDGAEALKSVGGEWAVQARWNRLVAEASDADFQTRHYSSLSQNMTVGFQQLSYIALIAVGAYLATEGKLTMGSLLACSIIGNRAMTPIVQLPGVMVQWALARAALDGLQQVIGMTNEADDAHVALAPETLDGSFRFEQVQFAYGMAKQAVLNVERLDIAPGERVGLIGPIGSGKSTLLKLASGLYRPGQGKVFLGGMDMATLSPTVAREIVGYLPQEPRLFSGTLRDNLIMGLADPGDEALLMAARRTGLIDLIMGQPAGLALELTEGGRGVSGGQKQLIAMTRMLLARPKVWLLDEPTGAMDSVTEARVVALLSSLAAEGVTLLVTTHKTALLPLLDRIVFLHGGRVQLDGPRDAVLAKLSSRPQHQEAAA